MKQDPICPSPLCDYTGKTGSKCEGYEDCTHACQCELIERVRKDEHDKATVSPLARLLDDNDATAKLAYKKALADAINSIKATYMRDGIAVRSQTEWGVELALDAITTLEGEK
jgi:hypothetical protein